MGTPMALKDFETLLDEARNEGLHRQSGAQRLPREPRPGPEFELSLGSLGTADATSRAGRFFAVPASVVLHGAAALALAMVPLLFLDALPSATEGVKAFFVEPIAAPPPPPPPPPPARASVAARATAKPVVQSTGFVAPVEVPTEIKPEDGLDFGAEGGVPGGVEGGVPGGVVGGVVGGLPDAPAPAAAKPVRVGGDVHEPRRLLDVAPVYPKLALKAGLEGLVIIEATINERGRVVNETVLRGVPILDEAALEAVRQWVYTPTLVDGVPTPVIMTVTVTFRLQKTPRN